MAVVHSTFSFQTESSPGTIQNYQGDLVEGRDYPDDSQFSDNETNLWTVLAATNIDRGDPLTDPNGWWDWWETHYVDFTRLQTWAVTLEANANAAPGGEPPHVNKLPGVGDHPPGLEDRVEKLETDTLETRKRVNLVIEAFRDLKARFFASGSAIQLFRVLFAIRSFRPGDKGFQTNASAPPTMTWDELKALGLPRATRRTDLRPELYP